MDCNYFSQSLTSSLALKSGRAGNPLDQAGKVVLSVIDVYSNFPSHAS